jgi:RNA polymerase sigma-70 factor (ECF subfamily)
VPEAEWQRQTATATEPMSMDVTKMLETLDDEDRALVVLKYAEGYSYEELSAIFDLSVSACKMRISRARDKLREQFSLEAETGA